MIRNQKTANHSVWGAGCDAWELLASADLSVKHERMPPASHEVRHYHSRAAQFFFVLSGMLTIELAGERYVLQAQDGLHVEPGDAHQAINEGGAAVEFLVISSPSTAGDRIEQAVG